MTSELLSYIHISLYKLGTKVLLAPFATRASFSADKAEVGEKEIPIFPFLLFLLVSSAYYDYCQRHIVAKSKIFPTLESIYGTGTEPSAAFVRKTLG